MLYKRNASYFISTKKSKKESEKKSECFIKIHKFANQTTKINKLKNEKNLDLDTFRGSFFNLFGCLWYKEERKM
jgi:hypothetical protein